MMNRQQGMKLNSLNCSAKSDSAVLLGPTLSQQTGQFRQQQLPSSRQMMTNMNPTLNRTGVGNGRMTGQTSIPPPSHCPSTHISVGNPASSSSWGYSQQGQSTTNPLPFSQIQDSSRPSSTNPYTSSSIQAFDRTGTGTPWQTNLDPSDFPALGSGTSNVLSHGPPSTPSYASTAGTGATHQQRLQQLGVFGRQQSGTNDDSPFNISAPFSQDEFPALGGMSGDGGHSQRQGLPQHLAGQSNGAYDPRQQIGQQIMTPPPGSQSLQQAQDHRASMLEALQQGQRVPPRTGVSPNILAGRNTDNLKITSGSSVKDHRNSLQSFQSDDQKVLPISFCS